MQAGTAFVYMTYGMYHCINISSTEPGAAVLLRAAEPLQGLEEMCKLRSGCIKHMLRLLIYVIIFCIAKRKSKSSLKELKTNELCNGPSKLCMSMDIRKDNCNKIDFCNNDLVWIEDDPTYTNDIKIVKSARIGIQSAGQEWANKLLRFYLLGNTNVSKVDKKAENNLSED